MGPYTGAQMIVTERQRQIDEENWDDMHDDCHRHGELAQAAACYALADCKVMHRPRWPWTPMWWKPRDPIRNLVRAGALIAAEIDRLQRKQER